MPLPPVPTFHPIANPDAVVLAKNVRFTVLTDRIIRLEYSKEDQFEDRPSQAFWHRDQPVPAYKKTVTESSVDIETDTLHLKYSPSRSGFTSRTLSITLKQAGVTWTYGARQNDNLKGTARTLDMDFGTTKLENGLLSRSGWAVVDDSKSLVFDETGWLTSRHPSSHNARKTARIKDLYFFGYGTDHAACLRDFTRLAGPVPLIPRYILGNWWSRYWAYTQSELKALMEDFRAHEVPLSVCIIDMDWHITKTGNASNGWTGYTWNRDLFPDPEGFFRWLHQQGLRTALNLHPANGVYPHEQQYKPMAKWMGIKPSSKQPISFDIADPHFMEGYFEILHHPYEHPGSSAMPALPVPTDGAKENDNFSERGATGDVNNFRDGVDFWWMDWQQGKKSSIPGLDPLWMLNHLHYHDLGRNGHKRPFVFSRWGGLGNHRYPIGFSGDTFIRWRTLAYQPYFTATAANVAYGWWSHDIGGHMFKESTPELYLRWVQFGVFSPIFRLHSTKVAALDRRPWAKPEPIFHAARAAMQLRHALIPYIYSMAWRAHQTGISLVTPMYYGNMEEDAAFEAKDQYFFGSELLAAPITQPVRPETGLAVKRVWFPSGTWFNFFTGERFNGGQWREITAGLEDIPVFAKAGAIVPLAPPLPWDGIQNPAELDLYIFPGADNTFDLFEDDGETTDYQRGKYAITRFSLQANTFTIHSATGDTSVIPPTRTYRLHIRGIDGAANRTLDLEPFLLHPDQSRTIEIRPSPQDPRKP
ncbi:MAG TPA: TIM-barrel domain-containing protein [Anaerolineaceae bacterium]|nr:TIM-barrel domain-containing protein [Anaerolineaceae bacterium]